MFCIIAFFVFLLLYPILGIFSADYRYLFRKSFSCVYKKATLKPCDIDLKTEIKGKLIGKTLARYPRFIKYFDKSFDIMAFLFVFLSIWSLVYSMQSGLNLFVYDTCTPSSGESCSLSGEACGVSSGAPTFAQAWEQQRLGEWATAPITQTVKTISLVPNRLKQWKASDYTTQNSSYYSYDSARPTALEIIDPGCKYCRQLYQNIKDAGFTNNYNLTYITYPIPDTNAPSGYKFQHSELITRYLHATTLQPATNSTHNLSPDWFLIDAIFTRNGKTAETLQEDFNLIYTQQQAIDTLHQLLTEYGYTADEIKTLDSIAQSDQVTNIIADNKQTVEKDINTIRIPTIIFDNRRYDRVVDTETLKR